MSSRDVLSSDRGSVKLSRRVLRDDQGRIRLLQRFEGDGRRVIVTHAAAVTAEVEVERGEVSFPLVGGTVIAPRRFTMFLPPRSVVPIAFSGAILSSDGVASFASSARGLPSINEHELDADRDVTPSVARARALLHDRLADPAPIGAVAREVGLAVETLSRSFAHAYVIAPKEYVHRARLFAAVLHILSGARIVDSAFQSGFADLSRFYQQFRRLLGATPGAYARIKKRQDAGIDREP
jgi:AraC-like DNA-binding protein